MGRVFVLGLNSATESLQLYVIDPSAPAGNVTPVATNLKSGGEMAFDGAKLWTPNTDGTLSYFTPGNGFGMTTVPGPVSWQFITFDGTNLWAQSQDASSIVRLDLNGNILQTVNVYALRALFDGANLWLTGGAGSATVTVVQASTGAVLAVLTGNGLTTPFWAGFDGQRVLISNSYAPYSASLWSAATLMPIGSVTFAGNGGVCSDGVNFWIARGGYEDLARF
jgi:hypothetical protein